MAVAEPGETDADDEVLGEREVEVASDGDGEAVLDAAGELDGTFDGDADADAASETDDDSDAVTDSVAAPGVAEPDREGEGESDSDAVSSRAAWRATTCGDAAAIVPRAHKTKSTRPAEEGTGRGCTASALRARKGVRHQRWGHSP